MKCLKKFVWKMIKFCFLFLILFLIGATVYVKFSPKVQINTANNMILYDASDTVFFKGNESKEWVNLEDISEDLINATIYTEDKNYYKHLGFDYLRIVKSLYVNIKSGATKQGASTITQQLAKNLYLTFDKTWERKLKEAWLTIELESQYEKDDILEAYLNTINYGGIYGIENASNYYFHKNSKDLNLAEASILAGIPKSPSNYSPITNEENAKRRQMTILSAMVSQNFITEDEKNDAYNTELTYYGTPEENELKTLMYYYDAVIQELDTIKSIPEQVKEAGGLACRFHVHLRSER